MLSLETMFAGCWRALAVVALGATATGVRAQPAAPGPAPLEDVARTLAELGLIEQQLAQPAVAAPAPAPLPPQPVSPDLFGTVALPAPAGDAAARWATARDAVVTSPVLDQLAATAFAAAPQHRLAAVQSIVNKQIAYRPDRLWWGLEDYWASADQTVMRGGGDCEDIAIVKLQLLRRLGYTAEQLYLAVGRLSGGRRDGSDHAVALVRLEGGGWWVLDDRFDRPVAAQRLRDFQPILTFAARASWIHGRRTASGAGMASYPGSALSTISRW